MVLRHGTEVVKNTATTICDSCQLPHHSVGQTNDTWCNVRCRSHIQGLCPPRHKSMHLPYMGSAPHLPLYNVANTMVACIVGTRLDFCITLLHSDIEKSLNKLQRFQNKLAQVICNVSTDQQHTGDYLRNLYQPLGRRKPVYRLCANFPVASDAGIPALHKLP